MVASAPPQIAMSASPHRMRRAASPMACKLAAHAVTGVPMGPLNPWRIEIHPAARLDRKDGTVKGDRRRTPRVSVVRTASAIEWKPPMPEATIVAVRVFCCSVAGNQPDWATASCAAPSAKAMKRSIFF
jgi:hypothetical protein